MESWGFSGFFTLKRKQGPLGCQEISGDEQLQAKAPTSVAQLRVLFGAGQPKVAWEQERALAGLWVSGVRSCPVERLLVFPLAACSCSEFQEGIRYARGRHLKYNKTYIQWCNSNILGLM